MVAFGQLQILGGCCSFPVALQVQLSESEESRTHRLSYPRSCWDILRRVGTVHASCRLIQPKSAVVHLGGCKAVSLHESSEFELQQHQAIASQILKSLWNDMDVPAAEFGKNQDKRRNTPNIQRSRDKLWVSAADVENSNNYACEQLQSRGRCAWSYGCIGTNERVVEEWPMPTLSVGDYFVIVGGDQLKPPVAVLSRRGLWLESVGCHLALVRASDI